MDRNAKKITWSSMPGRVIKRIAGNNGSPVKVCWENERIVQDPIHSSQCFRFSSCLKKICNCVWKNPFFGRESRDCSRSNQKQMSQTLFQHQKTWMIINKYFKTCNVLVKLDFLLWPQSKMSIITLRRATGSSNCLGKFLLRSMLFALFRPARLLSHWPSLMKRVVKDHKF